MSEQQGTVHGAVELRYRPVLQDYSAALRARNRVGAAAYGSGFWGWPRRGAPSWPSRCPW